MTQLTVRCELPTSDRHHAFGMRTQLLLGLSLLVGCAASSGAGGSHGETLRQYQGGIELVFTNATPDKMCGLYMSDNADQEYGDNWLPAGGLPSGQSIVLRVKPGTYKARWETCAKHGSLPTYCATLWRETGFEIDHETQLYAFVAEATPPTQRAAVMDRDHAKVMFQGQAVAPIRNHEAVPIAPVIAAKPAAPETTPAPQKAMFADVVEKPARRTAKTKR